MLQGNHVRWLWCFRALQSHCCVSWCEVNILHGNTMFVLNFNFATHVLYLLTRLSCILFRRLLESRTSCLNAVWSLDSTVMLRKYLGAGDVVVSILLRVARTVARREAVAYSFASPLGALHCLQALKQHSSQLVWFRYVFVIFSRYSYLNTLRKMWHCFCELSFCFLNSMNNNCTSAYYLLNITVWQYWRKWPSICCW